MRIITQWGKTIENVEGTTLYLSRHKRLNGEIDIKWVIADSTTQEKLGAYKELDKVQKTMAIMESRVHALGKDCEYEMPKEGKLP